MNNHKQKQAENTMKMKIKNTGELPVTASSNLEIQRDQQIAIDRGYQGLAAAVVIQAVEDYRRFEKKKLVARGHITLKGSGSPSRTNILALIKFLRGRGLGLWLDWGVFSLEQEMVMRGLGFNIYEVQP
jgi:hypothetical protein